MLWETNPMPYTVYYSIYHSWCRHYIWYTRCLVIRELHNGLREDPESML